MSRMNDGVGIRKFLGQFMVIRHNDIHLLRIGVIDGLMSGHAIVHGNDKINFPLLDELAVLFLIGAIPIL